MDVIINVVLVVIAGIFLFNRFVPVKGVNQITTEELKTKLKRKDIQFVDVRTLGEFTSNHIKRFKNIPLHELTLKSEKLTKDKEVVVICQSGMRSNKAAKLLKKMGFQQITNVKGGMSSWY
ncbi:rhodanese [Anaerobacillus alkalilacustris]|uniref:Rhodanese n=1 Tax=Anaerobacillus alkalilacustris TaxID=393763 RepID=A0A1S2LQJ9_9BACI|nr:rhodanese-like domain-containing protein [Anaerobacillus alkalilacustris]OIJ14403.1 rhodanese [Anaerobacillus alkalilacustris]